MKISRSLSARASSLALWLTASAAQTEPLAAPEDPPEIEHYRLEVVAHSLDYPPDPQASNRQFGPAGAQLNQAGQVLFTAHWRDGTTGRNDSSLNIGRPGQVTRVVAGTDPVPAYPGLVFTGRLDTGGGNFVDYTFNRAGELLFTGFVRHQDLAPSPPPIPFSYGLFKGSTGNFALLVGATGPGAPNPPPANVANAPYDGSGTLVFAPGNDGQGMVGFLADNGKTYFSGPLHALERDAFGNILSRPVVLGGLYEEQPTRRLILYPGGPAPGLDGDNEIVSFTTRSGIWGSSMGQHNGAFLLASVVRPRGSSEQRYGVFYRYHDGNLEPVYVQGDPLPDLPPLSEVLGTSEPYDVQVSLQAVDDMGHGAFFAFARPRNAGQARALGYWKTTTNGLAQVLRFDQEYPTPRGSVRFPAPPVAAQQRVAMGGGKVALVTLFTGLGYAAPTQGILRQTTNGFELVAAAGMNVFGTDFTLSNDFATAPIWANETNEVAFFASFRDSSTNRFFRALWAYGRDGYLRRVCYVGQERDVGGTNRIVSLVGQPHRLNGDGALAFLATFRDGTTAILRAVPPGYQDPRPAARDYYFTGTLSERWYEIGGGTPPVVLPRTNWEDSENVTRPEPPGFAESDLEETTYIPDGRSVLLDNARPRVGKLVVGKSTLDIRNELAVEGEFEALQAVTKISGPLGRLTLRGGGNLGVMSLDEDVGKEGFQEGARLILLAPEGQEKTYVAHKAFTYSRGFMHLGTGAVLEFRQSDEHADASKAVTRRLEIDGGALLSKTGQTVGKTLRILVVDWLDGSIGSTQERLWIETQVVNILPGKLLKRLAGGLEIIPGFGAILAGAIQRDDISLDGGTLLVGLGWTIKESSSIRKFVGGAGGRFILVGPAALHVGDEGDLRDPPPSINARIDVPFESTGVVEVDGPPESSLRITDGVKQHVANSLVGGEWRISTANLLEISGAPIETLGEKCVVQLEGTAEFRAFRLKQNAGHLTFLGHAHSAPQDVNNTGTFQLLGVSKLNVNGPMNNSGRLEIGKGAEIVVAGDFTHQAEGKLKIDGQITAGGRITLLGPLRGTGNLIAGLDGSVLGFIDVAGGLDVGSSPGVLSMRGSAQLRNTATLLIELAGTQTNEFDLFSVSGTASLDGTLAINLIENFRPAPEDSFVVLQAGAITGQFANAASGQRLATIDGVGSVVVNYTATTVVLTDFQASASPPPTAPGRLLAPAFGFNTVEFALTGSPGRDYILQTSTNLLDWLSLQTNNASFDGQLLFELPTTAEPARFFRALGRELELR